jgi:TRAP-type mannitol/chloroaromatic compound transport system permease small subunit
MTGTVMRPFCNTRAPIAASGDWVYGACASKKDLTMRLLHALSRAIDTLNRLVGRASTVLILASILVSAGNAFMRKAFALSSNFWLEAQWHLYGAAFLGAAGYVLLVDEHVRIDAVAQRFSPRLRAWLDLAVLLAVVLPLCVLMLTLGSAYFWRAFESGEASFHVGGPVRWPVDLFIPLGFTLLGLQAVSEAIKRAEFLLGRRSQPALSEADLPGFFEAPPAPGPRA